MRWGDKYHYIEATDDEVVFYDEDVKIFGNNRINKKSVYYSDITSVEIEDTGGLTPGISLEVRFLGSEKPYSFGFYKLPGSQATAALEEARTLKKYIEAQVIRAKEIKTVTNANSTVDDILKLKELLDNGLITPDEFNAMKVRLFSSVSKKISVSDRTMLTMKDFIIDTGKEKWNFVDWAKGQRAWYEFCETDVTYKAARGISMASTYENVREAFKDLKAYIDNQYDYSRDRLYIWSHKEQKDAETRVLIKCNRAIKFVLKMDDGYEYSITFYFDNVNKLRLVGYIKVST